MTPALALRQVRRRFGDGAGVDGVEMEVRPGELVAVLGPSGCGKTTLLRIAAGFERPDSGEVALAGRLVSGDGVFVPPEQRGVGLVFQSFALWPHLDVAGNVGYPLAVRGVRGAARRDQVDAALAAVGLAGFGERAVASLSGGQRQRVALARCLVMAPPLVLLDEPLASLDPHLKASLLDEIAEFRARSGAAMVYVTHDQQEAMALADRIAVMRGGRIEQMAPPDVLYREPASEFVARFVGQASLLPVEVLGPDGPGRCAVALGNTRFTVRGEAAGRSGLVAVRPEHVAAGDKGLPALVRRRRYLGGGFEVECRLEAEPEVRLLMRAAAAPEPGTWLRVAIADGWLVPRSGGAAPRIVD